MKAIAKIFRSLIQKFKAWRDARRERKMLTQATSNLEKAVVKKEFKKEIIRTEIFKYLRKQNKKRSHTDFQNNLLVVKKFKEALKETGLKVNISDGKFKAD